MSSLYRGSKACSLCHKKKIKCDLIQTSPPCTNCRVGNFTCRPHQRKRKRQTSSPRSPQHADPGRLESNLPDQLNATELPRSAHLGIAHLTDNVTLPHSPVSPASKRYDIPSAEQSYVGRGEYIGSQIPFTEDTAGAQRSESQEDNNLDLDLQYLHSKRAFDIPPRAIRESLIDAFMERCHPWMPIVERKWLEESDQRRPSQLLLQAVFMAGSRVSSSPLVHTTCSEFYERARALFFHGHEKNTILAVVAVCILQWWNPTGPEKFSTNTSGFWARIGVELAYQVGLHKEPSEGPFKSFRRRLWWTLVSRDSISSVGTGRPKTINLDDSTVNPPRVSDFPAPSTQASLFVTYVSICKQMASIAEAQRRQTLTPACRQNLEDALFHWLKKLPRPLRIANYSNGTWTLAPYDFEARQLAVPYFVCLILLHKPFHSHASPSTICLLASSFVITIIEEFLSRDQLRYLGPVFTFYALAAGLIQLTAFRHDSLQATAEQDFNVVKMTLEQLGARWGSAHGALRGLTKAKEEIQHLPRAEERLQILTSEEALFFLDFGPELCKLWDIGFGGLENRELTTKANSLGPPIETWDYGESVAVQPSDFQDALSMPQDLDPNTNSSGFHSGDVADINSFGMEDMALLENSLGHAEGSWLFDDFDLQGALFNVISL